jgi:uncharacterized protein YfiM (DUF2279 family)
MEVSGLLPEKKDPLIREALFGLYRIIYRVDEFKKVVALTRIGTALAEHRSFRERRSTTGARCYDHGLASSKLLCTLRPRGAHSWRGLLASSFPSLGCFWDPLGFFGSFDPLLLLLLVKALTGSIPFGL